jgi:hypothetical protein
VRKGNKNAIAGRLEQSGNGWDVSRNTVGGLPISVCHFEAFIELQFSNLIAALAIFVIGFSLPWKVGYFIALFNWQAGFRARGIEFCCGEVGV